MISSGSTSTGWLASASITGGTRQATVTAMNTTRKAPARTNEVCRRRAAASRSTGPDRCSSRHGAPSTISAGATMANTTNCADSATTYRRASPSTARPATIRAAPAAASQSLPGATGGGAACRVM